MRIEIRDKVAYIVGDFGEEYNGDQYRSFDVSSYRNLNGNNTYGSWKTILKPANDFIATLMPEEQVVLGRFFLDTKKFIDTEFLAVAQLSYIREKINKSLNEVFSNLNIANKVEAFAKTSNFVYPDLRFAGTRTHDSGKKTFLLHEFQTLTGLSVLCKMLAPIFGELMEQISNKVDKSLKETHTVGILAAFIDRWYRDIIDKLLYYIGEIATIPKNRELSFACAGFNLDRLQLNIYCNVLLKKFVNIDTYNKSGNTNILSHVLSAILNCKELRSITKSNKSIVLARIPVGEGGEGEEGNTSNFEAESFISAATADMPIMVKMIATDVVRSFITDNELDSEVFKSAVDFYMDGVLPITPLNKYLVSVLFGNDLGGAIGVDVLDMLHVVKLITLTQMFAIKRGFNTIVHALSVKPTPVIKTVYSITDNQIMAGKGMCYSYQNCKKMFPYDIAGITWDSKIKDICEFIVKYEHRYNTAPSIWKQLEEEDTNEGIYQYEPSIDRDIVGFIHSILLVMGQQEVVYGEDVLVQFN